MSPEPAAVPPDLAVAGARQLMAYRRIHHLPVVEGGRLVGIVTDWDVRLTLPPEATAPTLWEIGTLLARLTVGEVMSRDVLTIGPEGTLGEAARLMLARRIGALPVLEGGRLVGILTETDLVRALARAGRGPAPG